MMILAINAIVDGASVNLTIMGKIRPTSDILAGLPVLVRTAPTAAVSLLFY